MKRYELRNKTCNNWAGAYLEDSDCGYCAEYKYIKINFIL